MSHLIGTNRKYLECDKEVKIIDVIPWRWPSYTDIELWTYTNNIERTVEERRHSRQRSCLFSILLGPPWPCGFIWSTVSSFPPSKFSIVARAPVPNLGGLLIKNNFMLFIISNV
jgi:hypothetical protein